MLQRMRPSCPSGAATHFPFCFVGNAGLSLSSDFFISDLVYTGEDTFGDFAGNGGLEWVEELSQLQHSGIVDPVDGRTRPVIVLFVMDGAARRELTGRTSAASKHGLESNGMNADQIKDLSLAAPITLTPDIMKQAEPPPHMSMAQIKTRARDSSVGGIIGGNLLRCPPSRLLFDVLHINLRLVAT